MFPVTLNATVLGVTGVTGCDREGGKVEGVLRRWTLGRADVGIKTMHILQLFFTCESTLCKNLQPTVN
jgi:hypothetical protein